MADVPEGTVRGDPRMEFLSEYTLRSLRLKPDKWTRMLVSDEQRNFVNKFIDCYKPQVSFVLICTFKNVSKFARTNNTTNFSRQ